MDTFPRIRRDCAECLCEPNSCRHNTNKKTKKKNEKQLLVKGTALMCCQLNRKLYFAVFSDVMWPHGMNACVGGPQSTQNDGSIPKVSFTRQFSF